MWPLGVRLLTDGSGVVVTDLSSGSSGVKATDSSVDRVCVFSLSGEFVRSLAVSAGIDVIECDGGSAFLVPSFYGGTLSKVSVASGDAAVHGSNLKGSGDGQFNEPRVLALVDRRGSGGDSSDIELYVLEQENCRISVFRCAKRKDGGH